MDFEKAIYALKPQEPTREEIYAKFVNDCRSHVKGLAKKKKKRKLARESRRVNRGK